MNMQKRKLKKRKEEGKTNIINRLIKRMTRKLIKLVMVQKMMDLIM